MDGEQSLDLWRDMERNDRQCKYKQNTKNYKNKGVSSSSKRSLGQLKVTKKHGSLTVTHEKRMIPLVVAADKLVSGSPNERQTVRKKNVMV